MKAFCLYFLILLAVSSNCQTTNIKPVKVGGKLPDATFLNALGGNQGVKLSNLYKHKLLVIDFWATWCSPCYACLKKLDSISGALHNRVEILAVSYQKKAVIENSLNSHPYLKSINIQYIFADTLLHAYFPHRIIPHLIIVDSSGTVVAITSSEEINYSRLSAMLDSKEVAFHVKKDKLDFDMMKPYNMSDDTIFYRSTLIHSPDGLPSGGGLMPPNVKRDKFHKYNRFFKSGLPLIDIYMSAAFLNRINPYNTNMFVLRVKDSFSILPPLMVHKKKFQSYSEWCKTYSYLYELILPSGTSDTILFRYVLEDLDRSLPFRAYLKNERRPCWIVINKTPESEKLHSAGGKPRFFCQRLEYFEKMQNLTMDDLLLYVNYYSNDLLVLDETKNTEPFDMDLGFILNVNKVNMNIIRTRLQKYGFDIIKAVREIPILHIEDK